jgi:hypothetical protein
MSLPDFADVLRCYVFLLRRLGADFWSKESSDYPQVVFDAIKDNPSFADLTRDPGWKSNEPWLLVWFSNYLHSIWTWQIFDDVLVRMVDFLCEELQHERFQEARPACMIAATDVCLSPCLVMNLRIYWSTATSYRYLQIRKQGRFYPTHSRSSFARHSRGPLRLRGLLTDIQYTRVGCCSHVNSDSHISNIEDRLPSHFRNYISIISSVIQPWLRDNCP